MMNFSFIMAEESDMPLPSTGSYDIKFTLTYNGNYQERCYELEFGESLSDLYMEVNADRILFKKYNGESYVYYTRTYGGGKYIPEEYSYSFDSFISVNKYDDLQIYIRGRLGTLPIEDGLPVLEPEPEFDVLEEIEKLKINYSNIDLDLYDSLEYRLYPYNFSQVDFEPNFFSTGNIPISSSSGEHYIDSSYDWFSLDTYYGVEVVAHGIGGNEVLWDSMPFGKYCALPSDGSEYIFDVSPVYSFEGARNNKYCILTWYVTNMEDLKQELYYRQTETSSWIPLTLSESDIQDMSYLHEFEILPHSYRIRNVDKGNPNRVSDYSYFNPSIGATLTDGDPEWNEGGEVTTDNFFDWIILVLNGIVRLFTSFINVIFQLVSKTGQVGDLFSTIFKFVPAEIVSIIVLGFSVSILLRVFGR